MSNYKFETLQLHVGQEKADPVTDARAVPIYATTSYVFHNSQHAADRFGLRDAGNIYGRLTNSTQDVFEQRIAALEGGVAALAVASGAAAITYTIENLAQQGDHIVSAKNIYGGTFNLISVTMKKMGIDATFVSPDCTEEELNAAFKENTKAVFGETIANPALTVLDIEKFAKAAHAHHVPLIVDNTFLSPYFQNPLKLGADIVVHSGTKYLGGHNDTLAGFLITNREDIQEQLRFIIKTTGATLAPMDSWLILRGIKTLGVRMDRAQENALKIAHFLEKQEYVTRVLYPGLESHPGYELMKKQARGFGSILTFEVDSKERAYHILENVKLIQFAESLGGTETLITYPITQTHADLSKEELDRNGITDRILRLSVGIEGAEDLIADLEAVLK